MHPFPRIQRLPPYVFSIVNDLKLKAQRAGEDIVDLSMGNPDGATPKHIVDKAIETITDPRNHRYSASRGITSLRKAAAAWFKRRFDVDLDPESEIIATIGSKDGIAHGLLAYIGAGDMVMVPNPTYTIHRHGVVIAGGFVIDVHVHPDLDFFEDLTGIYKRTWPRPKAIVLNFPHNPTTTTVDLEFFKRLVAFAKTHNILVLHDNAYVDLCFDGYQAPSLMQIPEAKDVGIEFFSFSKTYNMPGWRAGFAVGNRQMIHALARIKSYLDYGTFQPLQIAATEALSGPQDCVEEIRNTYKQRRDALCAGLEQIGWHVEIPKATMFVWAKIPEEFKSFGSLEFAKLLLREAKVAVSPGIGFGDLGDDHVRFALVENEQRIKQALQGLKRVLGGGK
jgi:alanine-synthesizing transaminase